MEHYLRGETLIEAYWKSVAMPGQGIFIGDPLANPYSGSIEFVYQDRAVISTPPLARGKYSLLSSDNISGPYEPELLDLHVESERQKFPLKQFDRKFYQLVRTR